MKTTTRHFRRGYRRRSRGVFLLELLGVLAIMAAGVLLFSQTLASFARAQRVARDADVQIGRVDSCLAQLRRDAWSAAAFTMAPGSDERIDLQQPDGRVIRWSSSQGILTRSAPSGGLTTWGQVTQSSDDGAARGDMPDLHFAASATAMTVELRSRGEAQRVSLPSAYLLAGGQP